MLTLSNGQLYAKLVSNTIPKIYKFCLKVFGLPKPVIFSGMELDVVLNCSTVLSKVTSSINQIQQMYNSTQELQTVLFVLNLFSNTEESLCPIRSIAIKELGCQTEYQGGVLILNQNNEIQAQVNNINEIQQNICLVAQTQS